MTNAATSETKIESTWKIDRERIEFDLVTRMAPFETIIHYFETYPLKEVREICTRALEKRLVTRAKEASWYEKSILDLLPADREMAAALLKNYRGLYDAADTTHFERSLGFVSSHNVEPLPTRVIVRAIRSHLDGYQEDFDGVREIYRQLLVRHALERILAKCTRNTYSREEWETMEVVFWCAVHMKDKDLLPRLEQMVSEMSSRRGPGRISGGGDLFQMECHRAVVQRTIEMIRSGIPAKPHDLPKEKFKRWHQS